MMYFAYTEYYSFSYKYFLKTYFCQDASNKKFFIFSEIQFYRMLLLDIIKEIVVFSSAT